MIVDSSAMIAILWEEPEAEKFIDRIGIEPASFMSAASFFETAILVDSKRDPVASRELDDFCNKANIQLVAVDEKQARIARQAYRDFGKGSGHKARLNFGDCFAYALAKSLNEPLLFKGTDFSQTDV